MTKCQKLQGSSATRYGVKRLGPFGDNLSPNEEVNQPAWVCAPCGERWGHPTRRSMWSTWHPDTCGVCGEETSCTEPRDFGYLREGWESEAAKLIGARIEGVSAAQ